MDDENLMILNTLSPSPIVLSDEEKGILLRSAEREKIPKGAVIWSREDRHPPAIIIVLSGFADLKYTFSPKHDLLIEILRPGEASFTTVPSFLANADVHMRLLARTDVEVMRLGEEAFSYFDERYPEVSSVIEEVLARRLVKIMDLLRIVGTGDIPFRIVEYFRFLSDRLSTRTVYETHEKIAADIGSKRETVSRALKKLESDGLIRTYRGRIELLEPLFENK